MITEVSAILPLRLMRVISAKERSALGIMLVLLEESFSFEVLGWRKFAGDSEVC